MNDSLGIHHELLLLALHDRKGTHAYGQMVQIGLGGALLTELLLGERVRIVQEGSRRKKSFVEVVDASPTYDSAMDAALEKLKGLKRRGNPRDTVTRIGNVKKLRALVARDLCRKGVLRETEQEILLLFRRKVYPTVDPGPERELIARIRGALEGTGTVDDRTASLVAVADVTDTLGAIYPRKDRKRLKGRIKEVAASGEGKATRDAVEAARAAVTAAVTAAMIASTAAASS
jgi:golgi phosphoprotein 3